MDPAIPPAFQAEAAPTSIAGPSSAACPLPLELIGKCLSFVPPELRGPLIKDIPLFKAALETQDQNTLRSLKTFSTNLASLVNAEKGEADFPQELAPLSEEISEILETPGLTLLNREAKIFAKLIKLSRASFAYLYTQFNIKEYYFEETPFPSDRLAKTYDYLHDPDHPHTTLLQAQFYRGIAQGYLSDQALVVGNKLTKPTTLMLEELAKKGKLDLARGIFDSIPKELDERRDAFAEDFGVALYKAGSPGVALKVVRDIQAPDRQRRVFQAIWESFAELETRFEDMYEAMKNFVDLLDMESFLVPEYLIRMANSLLKKGRLDLVLDVFSHYQDGDVPQRTIPPRVYGALLTHFDEEHHVAYFGHDWREKTPIEVFGSNYSLLLKIEEMIPLAQSGNHAPVDRWLSELEKREDRKLCCAHLAIQLHLRGSREAARRYAALIN